MLDYRQFGISPDDIIPQFQNGPATVQIQDRICGAGKTNDMIKGLNPTRKYLIVTPLLEDVQEIIDRAEVSLYQPEARRDLQDRDDPSGIAHTKRGHLQELLLDGHSVVCSHKLHSDIAWAASNDYLAGYDVIIDEVPNTSNVLTTTSKNPPPGQINTIKWRNQYIRDHYAEIDADNRVRPTQKWKDDVARGENVMSRKLYDDAEAGFLWSEGDTVLIWELPTILLYSGRTVTIMTYRFHGSLLQAFMDKHGVKYEINVGHEDEYRQEEARLRARAKSLITIKSIPGLEGMKLSASAQEKLTHTQQRKFISALKTFRNKELKNAAPGSVLVTCLKSLWYADGAGPADVKEGKSPRPGPICAMGRQSTGLFKLCQFSANVTRGTNKFKDTCDKVLYLYDKNLHPNTAASLKVQALGSYNDLYAVSEMVQFVYRSAIRDGKPITLYIPSGRMRDLFQRWLDGELD